MREDLSWQGKRWSGGAGLGVEGIGEHCRSNREERHAIHSLSETESELGVADS